MKTLKQTSIYTSWGDPFDKEEVEQINKDIKEMFGEDASFIIEQSDDGFEIKLLSENERKI